MDAQLRGSQEASPKNGSIAPAASKSPLLIPQDASLSDSLQQVIMHHISKVNGASVESLTANETLLFHCHLSRITHYAQKLVDSSQTGISVSGTIGSDTSTRAGTGTST